MKNLVALFCAVSTFAAFAADGEMVFGALRVDSTAAQTIVSIPWAEAGTGGAIKVKDAIKTTNLTKGEDVDGTGGDQLYLYSNGSYKLWQLNKDDVWVGATPVAGDDQYTATAGSDTDELKRGDALILVRKNPSKPFYLYGQYTADAASLNVAKGTKTAPAYSLVAPAATTETELDSLASENVNASDTVVVRDSNGNTRALVCREVGSVYKWGTVVKDGMGGVEQFTHVQITIPAGEGFWYISRGGSLTASESND